MKKYYYITPDHQQRGPVDASMLASCGVDSNTMVWTEGMANWMPAGQVPDLAFYIYTAQSASSTPPPFNSGPDYPPYDQPDPQRGANSNAYGGGNQFGGNQFGGNQFGNANAAGSYGPYGMHSVPRPDNNMIWAVLSTIFCCLPTGIYAIILSAKVNDLYNQGDYAGAQQAADDAKKWALYGLIISIAINILFYVIAIGTGAFAIFN